MTSENETTLLKTQWALLLNETSSLVCLSEEVCLAKQNGVVGK